MADCDHWLPMVGMIEPRLPQDASWVVLLLPAEHEGARVVRAHWAHGGGDDQPAFGPGWFQVNGQERFGYVQVPDPIAWRPLTGHCARCGAALLWPIA